MNRLIRPALLMLLVAMSTGTSVPQALAQAPAHFAEAFLPKFNYSTERLVALAEATPADWGRNDFVEGLQKYGRSADGKTSFVTVRHVGSCSTRPTLSRSLSTLATPSEVLISVGQSEQSVTVTAEMTSDFGKASLGSM